MSVLNTERGGRPKGLLLFFFSRSKGNRKSKARKNIIKQRDRKLKQRDTGAITPL
jgi:hypothetical protein